MNDFMNYGYGPPLPPPKKRRKKRKQLVPVYWGYGYGPILQQSKRRGTKRPLSAVQEISGFVTHWEKQGQKAYKGYKKAKKVSTEAYEAHKKRKAEGRDTMTLTKHYAGQAKQFVRQKHSIYYQKKKGIGSKLKGLFGKK